MPRSRPAAVSEMATYVYGLLEAAKAPPAKTLPAGLTGAGPVRLIPAAKGLWLLCSEAPLTLYGEEAISGGLQSLEWVSERAIRHEAVVEWAMAHGTVVPMKLFTLFRSEARAVEQLTADRRVLDAVLERLRGCEELGVRVSVDDARARQHAGEPAAAGPKPSGAAFLQRKKQARDLAQESAQRSVAAAADTFEALRALARDGVQRPLVATELGKARLLLDAAFLVPRRSARSFRAAADKLGGALGEAYQLTVTGPWPPYNFIHPEH